MTKNLKLSFILSVVLATIVIAWRTLSNFFGGVALNYVSVVIITITLLGLILTDNFVLSRIKDLFIISCVFAVLETIVYFPFEFGACANYNVAIVFWNFQNVFSFLGILFLAYTLFRFITEIKNIKIAFVEIMLGNKERTKKEKKVKKSKEFSNGSLEEKPVTSNENKQEDTNNIQTETSTYNSNYSFTPYSEKEEE